MEYKGYIIVKRSASRYRVYKDHAAGPWGHLADSKMAAMRWIDHQVATAYKELEQDLKRDAWQNGFNGGPRWQY